MLSTWLFILIIGDAALSMEMRNRAECLTMKEYVAIEIAKNEELRDKVALGCFLNLGVRTRSS